MQTGQNYLYISQGWLGAQEYFDHIYFAPLEHAKAILPPGLHPHWQANLNLVGILLPKRTEYFFVEME